MATVKNDGQVMRLCRDGVDQSVNLNIKQVFDLLVVMGHKRLMPNLASGSQLLVTMTRIVKQDTVRWLYSRSS